MSAQFPVIMLMGPTASGKTDTAVQLCKQLPCDIISVDSAMVYRGMDIGTAKPDAQVRRVAPHRLIDIRDPSEPYSAADFVTDAHTEIQSIHAAARVPLLVGGTGLYFKALQRGLSPLPSADKEVRKALEKEANLSGWGVLHDRLARVDPLAAARIHRNDPQRIQRALEVFEITGVPMSDLQRQADQPDQSMRTVKIILATSDREQLRVQIAERFYQMLERGFVREVQTLFNRGDLHPELPSMRAVGYRQIWQYLEGELTYDQMIKQAIVATRQFAKRQFTWLRTEREAQWFDSLDSDRFNKVLKTITKNLTPV